MSCSDNTKFKFRIVVGKDVNRPYSVQQKKWIFWLERHSFKYLVDAEEYVTELCKLETMRPGRVITEFDDQDYAAYILKNGKQNTE